MPDVHSIFPPSSAERHLNCTPSLLMEAEFPGSENEASKEGTYAHWVAEKKILTFLNREKDIPEEPEKNENWNFEEIDKDTDNYIDFIKKAAESINADAIIPEQQVHFEEWVPGGFGTSDCIILSNEVLYIIDFKYGRIPVKYEDNTQMKIYALGALSEFRSICPNLKTVKMSIFQPKTGNFGNVYEMSIQDLLAWAEDFVKPNAKNALEGRGELKDGPWCKYCKARSICKRQYEKEVALFEKKEKLPEPTTISDDAIAELLPKLKGMIDWCNDLLEYATDEAVNNGKKWPGMVLKSGRVTRVYNVSEEEVKKEAKENSISEELLYERKFVTPAKLEKVAGKKLYTEKFKRFVDIVPGKPVLAPDEENN